MENKYKLFISFTKILQTLELNLIYWSYIL